MRRQTGIPPTRAEARGSEELHLLSHAPTHPLSPVTLPHTLHYLCPLPRPDQNACSSFSLRGLGTRRWPRRRCACCATLSLAPSSVRWRVLASPSCSLNRRCSTRSSSSASAA